MRIMIRQRKFKAQKKASKNKHFKVKARLTWQDIRKRFLFLGKFLFRKAHSGPKQDFPILAPIQDSIS
jgi:hypothetical protein